MKACFAVFVFALLLALCSSSSQDFRRSLLDKGARTRLKGLSKHGDKNNVKRSQVHTKKNSSVKKPSRKPSAQRLAEQNLARRRLMRQQEEEQQQDELESKSELEPSEQGDRRYEDAAKLPGMPVERKEAVLELELGLESKLESSEQSDRRDADAIENTNGLDSSGDASHGVYNNFVDGQILDSCTNTSISEELEVTLVSVEIIKLNQGAMSHKEGIGMEVGHTEKQRRQIAEWQQAALHLERVESEDKAKLRDHMKKLQDRENQAARDKHSKIIQAKLKEVETLKTRTNHSMAEKANALTLSGEELQRSLQSDADDAMDKYYQNTDGATVGVIL